MATTLRYVGLDVHKESITIDVRFHAPDEQAADLIEQMLDLTRTMRSYAPSMLLDFDHGRPLEIDAMYRAPLSRAAAMTLSMSRYDSAAGAPPELFDTVVERAEEIIYF